MAALAITNSPLVQRRLLSCGLLLSLVWGTPAIAGSITTGTFQGHGGSISFSNGGRFIVTYNLTSDTGDSWTGIFEIPDKNVAAGTNDPTVSVSGISAVNGETSLSYPPNYYGSNSAGYVSWAGYYELYTGVFQMWSPDLRNVISGGATWNDLVSAGTFALSTELGEDSKFWLEENPPSPAVPEIDPAGMGSILALLGGGLGLVEKRRRRTQA